MSQKAQSTKEHGFNGHTRAIKTLDIPVSNPEDIIHSNDLENKMFDEEQMINKLNINVFIKNDE